ncbi:MAG: glycosyltransferase family 2 protein [Aliarcobacter butzleri]|nr:glycosyltransferase family 2 protein [Aliarcobacter butzleri]
MTDIESLDEGYSTTRLIFNDKCLMLNEDNSQFNIENSTSKKGGLRTKGYFKKSFDDKPLISIITVVFNGEKYLEETIQSVTNQTYDNVEYIIIDGGSSDGTLDIIKKYEDKIDYWVSEKDKGIYDAMNKGIDAASGEFINFLNAGDRFVDEHVLEKIFAKLDTSSCDLIYGSSVVTGDQENVLLEPKKFTKFNLYFWNTRVVCHQAMFVRKDIVGKYSMKYRLKGELNWYLDLVEKVKSYKIVEFSIVFYALGGAGDINYKLNTLESLKVVFARNVILGCVSLPVIAFKYIRKVLK